MHIAYKVADIAALIERLAVKGYHPCDQSDLNSHPYRKRVYYRDDNNVEWEFIEYLSDRPELCNDYQL